MGGNSSIKNDDFIFGMQSSADIYGLERSGGVKPTRCHPMNAVRENLAYATVDDNKKQPRSSNEYKLRRGACMRCYVLYKWRGLPVMRESLCPECGSQLERARESDLPTLNRIPLAVCERDKRHGACVECRVIYHWQGLPCQRDALCPECSGPITVVSRKTQEWRRIVLSPLRKVYDDES